VAYVEISELSEFILEVCNCFFNNCTKIISEVDVIAPLRNELDIEHLLEFDRLLTDSELQQVIQLMERIDPVERNGISYSGRDFLGVLKKILELQEQFSELSAKEIKQKYQRILHDYAGMNIEILFSRKIHSRIRGIRGSQKRFSDGLYQKQKVIFDFMLKRAKQEGKWKNLNAAVDSVLPELEVVLKEFDKKWISNKLSEKNAELECLEKEFEKHRKKPPSYSPGIILTKTRDQTFIDNIRAVRMECNDLEKALQMADPSLILKKRLSFNTVYQPEVIKNLLRRQPSLLEEIIESTL